MRTQPALIALGIALVGAAMEGILAGRGVRQRLAELRQPAFAPPLALWAGIGLLYYATCFGVAYRLLRLGLTEDARIGAFALLLGVMIGNAFWNYAFFRRKDLRLTLWVTVAYGVAAVVLAGVLFRLDPVSGWLLVPYLLYLVYGMWWSYAVWRLNAGCER